jgi:hypothetical protein
VVAPYGRQERAVFVDVNAHTGELLVADDAPQKILANVQSFVADSASN